MNRLWISGWAIPPAWLAQQARAAWPDDHHVAVTPSDAAHALAHRSFDALGGYSLGALWLLQHADSIPSSVPVCLLAPILGFPAEAGRGGRVALTQLKLQRRRLRRDAPAAVIDFIQRAGLDASLAPLATAELTPARIAELETELGWLETWQPPVPSTASTWQGFVGDQDALLDGATLHRLWPAIQIVPGATHAPHALLAVSASAGASAPTAHPIVLSFDRAADTYDSHAAPQAALAAALADWIPPSERKGQALEFGAGTGGFTRHMMPWNGCYRATDGAPRMIARGRVRCPGAHWQVATADQTMPGSADWIFACGLLHWMPDPADILRRWRAMLAPGGKLAVAIFLRETLGELQALLPDMPTPPWRSVANWQHLFHEAGFVVTREAEWTFTSWHASSHELLRNVHAMGVAPHRTLGAGSLRTALREYDRRHASSRGVPATWHGWLARARAGS